MFLVGVCFVFFWLVVVFVSFLVGGMAFLGICRSGGGGSPTSNSSSSTKNHEIPTRSFPRTCFLASQLTSF